MFLCCFYGSRLLACRPTPNLEDQGSLLVWYLTLDQSGMVKPTRDTRIPAGIVLRITEAHKLLHNDKVVILGVVLTFYIIVINIIIIIMIVIKFLLHYWSIYYITGRLLNYRSIYYITGRFITLQTTLILKKDSHMLCKHEILKFGLYTSKTTFVLRDFPPNMHTSIHRAFTNFSDTRCSWLSLSFRILLK